MQCARPSLAGCTTTTTRAGLAAAADATAGIFAGSGMRTRQGSARRFMCVLLVAGLCSGPTHMSVPGSPTAQVSVVLHTGSGISSTRPRCMASLTRRPALSLREAGVGHVQVKHSCTQQPVRCGMAEAVASSPSRDT